jgi:hypothetical protein
MGTLGLCPLVPVQIEVGGTQPLIKRLPGAARAALQAHDTVTRPMQLHDVSGADGLMQPVDSDRCVSGAARARVEDLAREPNAPPV